MTDRAGIICAGNWIVDLVHDIDHWPAESDLVRIGAQRRGVGGGAANVVSALAKLETGLPLWPMGAIGDDEHGQFILSECRALGLPVDKLVTKPGVSTAHTHVMSVPGDTRTFFYHGGANDALGSADFPTGTFAGTPARLFYLGYLSLLGDLDDIDAEGVSGAARVLDRAQKAGLVTCVDLVSLRHPQFAEIVTSAAPHIDYLIVNEIEAARAIGERTRQDTATEAASLLDLAHRLMRLGVHEAVVIHCTERVVMVSAAGAEIIVDVASLSPDEIANNLGAGDAFCAGMLYGIHESWAPDRAIGLAIATAGASLKGYTATDAIPALADLMPAS